MTARNPSEASLILTWPCQPLWDRRILLPAITVRRARSQRVPVCTSRANDSLDGMAKHPWIHTPGAGQIKPISQPLFHPLYSRPMNIVYFP